MSIGHETKPLSARLQAKMAAQQSETDALIASALTNFASAISTTLTDAQATIAADLNRFTSQTRRNLNLTARVTRFSPWVLTLLTLLIPSFIISLSWTMAGWIADTRLADMGLTISRSNDRTLILLDPRQARIIKCNSHDKCIEIRSQ